MNMPQTSVRKRLQRVWWRWQGEQPLTTTFWPQDYPCGTECSIGDWRYHITRYVRAADPRFFEVWGRPLTRTLTPQGYPMSEKARV